MLSLSQHLSRFVVTKGLLTEEMLRLRGRQIKQDRFGF